MKDTKKYKIRNGSNIMVFIFIFLGISLLLYPFISNYYATKNQAGIIEIYKKDTENKKDEFYEKELEKAILYNQKISKIISRVSENPDYSSIKEYNNILNINGIIGYISIPKIDTKIPIYHGTSNEVLKEGVGHLETSHLPIGGPSTHAVLTGHRGLPNSNLFTDLDLLKEGDYFYIYVLNKVLTYKVDNIKTVLPSEASTINVIENEDHITLVTCTPYGINTHRLLVRGIRVDYIPEEISLSVTGEAIGGLKKNNYLFFIALLFSVFIFIMFLKWIKRNLKNRKSLIVDNNLNLEQENAKNTSFIRANDIPNFFPNLEEKKEPEKVDLLKLYNAINDLKEIEEEYTGDPKKY